MRWSVTITSAPPPRLPPPNLRRRRDDPAAVTFTPCAARNARTSSMNGVKRPRRSGRIVSYSFRKDAATGRR